jgi:redox-sensitive bicupin YhaK (pirin superfamily)
MGFGALRVINDDTIDPSNGFGMHPHRDMEIITIVTKGTVTHQDSMGNKGEIRAGQVQVMSAGTGVVHSEYNDSPTEALELFQIWIFPHTLSVEPRYAEEVFVAPVSNILQPLVVPLGEDGAPLGIQQDAYISRLVLEAGSEYRYGIHRPGNGLYVFVVDGAVGVAEEVLTMRDAVGVWDTELVTLNATERSELLLIEVPVE